MTQWRSWWNVWPSRVVGSNPKWGISDSFRKVSNLHLLSLFISGLKIQKILCMNFPTALRRTTTAPFNKSGQFLTVTSLEVCNSNGLQPWSKSLAKLCCDGPESEKPKKEDVTTHLHNDISHHRSEGAWLHWYTVCCLTNSMLPPHGNCSMFNSS